MDARLLILVAFVAAPLAGCVSEPGDAAGDAVGDATDTVRELLAGPALWDDPQNAPHPAYGWPTLSNPPVGEDIPSFWKTPISSALPPTISGMDAVASAEGQLSSGAGISVFGSLVVVPGTGNGTTSVVDISDPLSPQLLSKYESPGRGSAIIAYPDGRLVAVTSTGYGFDAFDITDPTNPFQAAAVEPSQGGHKLGVVPGTPLVYNAASIGGTTAPLYGPDEGQLNPMLGKGVTEIYDLTDPEDPQLVQEFPNGYACHHIFFWISSDGDKSRAVCAGLQYTQLWDIEDPRNPSVIVSIPVHYGVANGPSTMASIAAFSHSAGMNRDGTVLYVGDESGGGGLPPGCVASANTPAGSPSVPVGATWFYDVSDEENPLLLGWYSPGKDAGDTGSCTTHHGRLVPSPDGRDLLAMSYYQEGTILIDFTGIGRPGGPLPSVVDQFDGGGSTWETAYAYGYLFTGGSPRGMDVLRLV